MISPPLKKAHEKINSLIEALILVQNWSRTDWTKNGSTMSTIIIWFVFPNNVSFFDKRYLFLFGNDLNSITYIQKIWSLNLEAKTYIRMRLFWFRNRLIWFRNSRIFVQYCFKYKKFIKKWYLFYQKIM